MLPKQHYAIKMKNIANRYLKFCSTVDKLNTPDPFKLHCRGFRLSNWEWQALKEAAERRENRPSSLIRFLIQEYLERYLWEVRAESDLKRRGIPND